MDTGRLEEVLYEMLEEEGSPAADFFSSLAEVCRTGNWDELARVSPELAINLKRDYDRDPDAYLGNIEAQARTLDRKFIEHADLRLESLTRLNCPGPGDDMAEMQQLLDRKGQLLEYAIARELISLITPASRRASHFKGLKVSQASSIETDKYLNEAFSCYVLGLYSASVMMCRSVLEEALKRRIPNSDFDSWKKEAKPGDLTLGRLLWKAKGCKSLQIDRHFFSNAEHVKEAGNDAAHDAPVGETKARSTLLQARIALLALLGKSASPAGPRPVGQAPAGE